MAEKLEIVVSGRVLEYFSMLALKFGPRDVEGNGWMDKCGAALEKDRDDQCCICVRLERWVNSSTDVNNLQAATLPSIVLIRIITFAPC